MKRKIVMDTSVFISALRSSKGASYKLLSMIDGKKFELQLSVPLLLEYEAAAQKQSLNLSEQDVVDILDYICSVANKREIFFLWLPYLRDPKDDLVLELAVESESEYIVTFNKKDFGGIEKFRLKAVTPQEFLRITGEIK